MNHLLAAPGSCITSTSNTGGTLVTSGSSMAAPHVAGTVALCINRGITQHDGYPRQRRGLLSRRTAHRVWHAASGAAAVGPTQPGVEDMTVPVSGRRS